MRSTRTALVAAALVAAVVTGAEEAHAADRSFEITASRFEFNPSSIQVQEGDRVKITVKSADTTHGFAIKAYKVKLKVPKGGEPVSVEFVTDKAGTFDITCSEYCGPGHRGMKGKLLVEAKAK